MNPTALSSLQTQPRSPQPLQAARDSAAALADGRRQGSFAGLLDRAAAVQPGTTDPVPAGRDGEAAKARAETQSKSKTHTEPAPRPTVQEHKLDPDDPEMQPVSFPGSGTDDEEAPTDRSAGSAAEQAGPQPWWSSLPGGPMPVDRAAALGSADPAAAAAEAAAKLALTRDPGTAQPVPLLPTSAAGPGAGTVGVVDGELTPAGALAAAAAAEAGGAAAAADGTDAANGKNGKNGIHGASTETAAAAALLAAGASDSRAGRGNADGAATDGHAADPSQLGILAALTGPASAPGAAVAATATPSRLSASPGSAEFAAQLGTSIATFVRQGLHQARLQLNPLEMGPLTVQIQLDGARAQVHLLADHAQTRQALEQALPQLAGSLREAGLTLTGGGVSDHPRQPPLPSDWEERSKSLRFTGDDDGGSGGTIRIDAENHQQPVPLRPTGARRGVVDLIA